MKDLFTKLNNLKKEIEIKQAEITSLKTAYEEYSKPFLKLLEDGREKLREQCAGPNKEISELNDEVAQTNEAIVEKVALYKHGQELRTATGVQLVLDMRHLLWNTENEFHIQYHVMEGRKGYSYTEKEVTEKIKKGEWKLATKSTFKFNSDCTFVHVVPITRPPDVLNEKAFYYLGLTARGNGVIFFNQAELAKERLPKKDNPNIKKLRLHKPKGRRARYYKEYCILRQVVNKGEVSTGRYNMRLSKYIGIYKAVDKNEAEELVQHLL